MGYIVGYLHNPLAHDQASLAQTKVIVLAEVHFSWEQNTPTLQHNNQALEAGGNEVTK